MTREANNLRVCSCSICTSTVWLIKNVKHCYYTLDTLLCWTLIVKTAVVLSTIDFGNRTAFASDVTLQNIIMHMYTTSHYRNIVEQMQKAMWSKCTQNCHITVSTYSVHEPILHVTQFWHLLTSVCHLTWHIQMLNNTLYCEFHKFTSACYLINNTLYYECHVTY